MAFAQELQAMVMPEGGEFRLCNTICEPTSERQRALKSLVEEDRVDLILAIGGRKSSNTARLAEVGQSMGVNSHHIERPEEIAAEWLEDVATVGVTAGASTPDDVIEAVVAYLAERGYAPPPGGIRPVDPDYVPGY
jgi:4-hydroxy-3-methylbut-2-enyl diphosphate reductase